jgi:hypothetical protein|tara:strand:+ start:480 stop:968 length:489 start_codon:yes stop_codon:yes gene_type:complete
MSEEIWKDVVGYEGDYQVSNMGRVKSFKKYQGVSSRIIKPSKAHNGYLVFNLCKNNSKKTYSVHKIIQESFNLGKGVVDHIDGNRVNNMLSNLRVGSQRDNCRNLECHRNGKLVGAHYSKRPKPLLKPWRSQISIKGISKKLGYFATELEAHNRYIKELENQ